MLYFVRHGQTDDNINGNKLTGWIDVPLNKTGVLQAEETALKLKDEKFDISFCSPLKRAKQTLKEILQYHKNLKVIYDDRLKERDYGKLSGVPEKEANFKRWDGNAVLPETVETPLHLYDRIKNFLDEILPKYSGKNILLVAHGGVGRMVYYYFNGIPKNNNFGEISINNAEILKFNN